MMRCRTGSAQSSGAPSLKACGGPDQRRTASRLLRPKIVEGLVYALALRRIRDTEPRCVSSSVVGASLETRRLAKPGRLRPMIDAQVVLNGLVLGGLYACVAVGFSLVWGVLNIINLLHDVSFQLWPGEIVGLIGPNGAGKTTLVNLTTGALRPGHFREWLHNLEGASDPAARSLMRLLAGNIAAVEASASGRRVIENVAAAAFFAGKAPSISAAKEQARARLAFVGLGEIIDAPANTLTLPNRKRLELAKSMAMNPRVMLLDEVNAALSSGKIDAALDLIRRISSRGITIVIIEHLMKVVFSLSHRILVLRHGALISEGKPDMVASDERVIRAYLGSKFVARRQSRV
jgi:branched-chain amino acid transport system ATP-binding protein